MFGRSGAGARAISSYACPMLDSPRSDSSSSTSKASSRKPWTSRLGFGVKIGLASAAATIAALAVSFGLGLHFFQNAFIALSTQQQMSSLQSEASSLDAKLGLAIQILSAVASQEAEALTQSALHDPERARSILERRTLLRQNFPHGIYLTRPDGTLLFTSFSAEAANSKTHETQEAAIRSLVQSAAPKGISESKIFSLAPGRPGLAYAIALPSSKGHILYLAGAVDLLADSMAGPLSKKKFGETGYFYMLSTTDRTMAMHPNPDRILRLSAAPGQNKGLDHALSSRSLEVHETVNSTGTPMFAAFSTLKNAKLILAATYPKDEARAALDKTLRSMAFAIAALAFLGPVLAAYLSSMMLRPLKKLSGHLELVAGGSPEHWPQSPSDSPEIKSIGSSYNAMIDSLAAKEADRAEAHERLEGLNRELEQRVNERTKRLEDLNAELTETLARSEMMKTELVRSEKLAALGRLVAGIAHEVNTPIGNARLVSTALSERAKILSSKSSASSIKRSELEAFFGYLNDSTHSLELNLNNAAELIQSFKQVAADQTSARRRIFPLAEACGEFVATIEHAAKRKGIEIETDFQIAQGIIDSYPGSLVQILTILFSNAAMHAFGDHPDKPMAGTIGATPCISIQARTDEEHQCATLILLDNGQGIPPDVFPKIFDPFFTTKPGTGGTGLGLSIAHGLAVDILGGSLSAETWPWGTRFTLKFPMKSPFIPRDATQQL